MTDLIDQTRREITDRIEQLRPAVAEYARLQAAAEALTSIAPAASTNGAPPAASAAPATPTPRRRRPGRPRRSATARPASNAAPRATTPRRRGGRPKGSGTRSAEALTLVEGKPGITIREIAAKMKIAPNYLYRVLPPLEKEGKIEKKGNGWQPAGSKS